MLKVGIIGIVAASAALIIKKDKPELALLLGISAGTIIFMLAVVQLAATAQFFETIVSKLPIDTEVFARMLKRLGIAYAAEFSSAICKDSGHSAIAAQIELFAKVMIVTLSIPALSYLVQIMGDLL